MAPEIKPLDENEKAVFELINKNDLNGLKAHMSQHGIKANILDEHGTTLLFQACYKGNYDIAHYLLDQGADPNDSNHQHGYTALHFAGLSGNTQLCQLLLEAGANPASLNSVGRTAAETAAFVGNYQVVATINSFIPLEDVEYYSSVHGLEKEPKLPPNLATPLHRFIIQVNLHPVRLALNLLPKLINNLSKIKSVLELMCSREMRKGSTTNEVLAFKLHYLSCIVAEVAKHQDPDKEGDGVETFIKKVLKSGRGEGYMDLLIRESVREFPYRKSNLFIQMVSTLAKKNESPEALSVITQAINGHRGFADEIKTCATCGEENPSKKCSKCRQVHYCDRECQRLHWFIHKKECNRNTGNTEDVNSKLEIMKITEKSNEAKETIEKLLEEADK